MDQWCPQSNYKLQCNPHTDCNTPASHPSFLSLINAPTAQLLLTHRTSPVHCDTITCFFPVIMGSLYLFLLLSSYGSCLMSKYASWYTVSRSVWFHFFIWHSLKIVISNCNPCGIAILKNCNTYQFHSPSITIESNWKSVYRPSPTMSRMFT